MKYISLFSGIEAVTVAWSRLGWEAVAFSEIDPFACAVLKERFPDVPNLGDITQINWKEVIDKYGAVDIVVGGSPCQSFSIAGNRKGLNGESGLMFEYVRAVREIMPRYFVWENVPGALSSTKGEDFRCLLESMDKLGYGLAWRVLDAQFYGVSQRRRRVFLVGSLGDQRASEILFEREGLSWDSKSSKQKREELTRAIKDGIGTKNSSATQYGNEIAGTLTAADSSPCSGRGYNVVCMGSTQTNAEVTENFTPAQCARQYKDPPVVCAADE